MNKRNDLLDHAVIVIQTGPRGQVLYATVSDVGGVPISSWTADVHDAINYGTEHLADAAADERDRAGYYLAGWTVGIAHAAR